MRAYILYSRYIKRLLLALHYYTGTAVLVVVRSQTFLLLVLRNLSSAPLSTLLISRIIITDYKNINYIIPKGVDLSSGDDKSK